MNAPPHMTTAFIAIGSNLGDRLNLMRQAACRLSATDNLKITARASIYETSPVGGPPDQPNYFNSVIQVETFLSPQELLDTCLKIEHSLGRSRSEANAPRTMDLDLLLHGQTSINTSTLQIPHPRMHLRRFVLQPLSEISPNLIHPKLNETISSLLVQLPDTETVSLVYGPDW